MHIECANFECLFTYRPMHTTFTAGMQSTKATNRSSQRIAT